MKTKCNYTASWWKGLKSLDVHTVEYSMWKHYNRQPVENMSVARWSISRTHDAAGITTLK